MRRPTFCVMLLLAALALPPQAPAQFSPQGNPFGQVGRSSGPLGMGNSASQASAALTNARIYHLGVLGQPGRWEVRGDGSGPILVGGDVYLPGGPGERGRFLGEQATATAREASPMQKPSGDQPELPPRRPEETPAPEPVVVRLPDLTSEPVELLLSRADSNELLERAASLSALPAAAGKGPGRSQAVEKLLQALDDRDLRIVSIAARSLGRMRVNGAEQKLLDLLNSDNAEVLNSAAWALGAIGTLKGLPALDQLAELDGPAAQTARAAADHIREVIRVATSAPSTAAASVATTARKYPPR